MSNSSFAECHSVSEKVTGSWCRDCLDHINAKYARTCPWAFSPHLFPTSFTADMPPMHLTPPLQPIICSHSSLYLPSYPHAPTPHLSQISPPPPPSLPTCSHLSHYPSYVRTSVITHHTPIPSITTCLTTTQLPTFQTPPTRLTPLPTPLSLTTSSYFLGLTLVTCLSHPSQPTCFHTHEHSDHHSPASP